MKIRSLDFDQFRLEKNQIADKLKEWQLVVKSYFAKNYKTCTDAGSIHFWESAVNNLIEYYQVEFNESDIAAYKSASFRLFLIEDQELEGIAFGRLKDYNHKADTFFGIRVGMGFEIDEMFVSPDNLLSRCFPIEPKHPQKHVERALLLGTIDFLKTMNPVYPIVVRPENSDKWTEQFLENNLFVGRGGAFGMSYKLESGKFDIVANSRQESIGENSVLIIDDYDDSLRGFNHR